MKKKIFKSLAVLLVIGAALTVLLAVGGAFTAKDADFVFNTPTYVKLNTVVEGALNTKDDYEAFLFEVPKRGALSFSMEHEKRSDVLDDGWHITLYKINADRSYSELMFTRAYLNEITEHWGETGVTPGSYVAVVEPGRLFIKGTFKLENHYVPTDTYEIERNETAKTATPLSLNYACYGASQGRTKGVDADWYVFELKQDRCVTVTFNHSAQTMPQSGWNVTVQTADGDILSDFTSKLTDTANTSGTLGLKAGKYYVRVDSQVLSTQTYSVLVAAADRGAFEYEPNGDGLKATVLAPDTTVQGALATRLMGLDRDYFRIVNPSDSVVTIHFRHDVYEGSKGGWNLRILDNEGNELVKKVSYWNQKDLTPGELGLKKGTYYLCVDADSLAYNNGEYALSWSYKERSNFEAEPNNERAQAKTVTIHSYNYGALINSGTRYDVDWYKLTLDEDKRVSLELGHERIMSSAAGWTVTIVNSSGKTVKAFDFYQNLEVDSTELFTLKKGTYYIRIEPGLEATEATYNFRVVG